MHVILRKTITNCGTVRHLMKIKIEKDYMDLIVFSNKFHYTKFKY